MIGLNNEYLGFLKFLKRAKGDIISWFGPRFDHDARRIALMAAREWDGMDEKEKKYFVISTQPSHQINDLKKSRFVSYLIQRRYASPTVGESPFSKMNCKQISQNWKSLSEEERQTYSSRKIVDICMDHIIEQRSKLHKIYEPLELNTLEFLLKTKPVHPLSARSWFFKQRNLSIKNASSSECWDTLDDSDKQIYDACAVLDRRRYKFETSAWLTKLVSSDLSREELSIDDFKSPELNANLETLCSILEASKKPIPVELRKRRPRGPFSLFIEYHRYQIRNQKPEFRFAEHLRSSADAWHKLTEEQKEVFREQSRKLKLARKEEIVNEDAEASLPKDLFKISKSAHGPCHLSHLVPMRPNLLQLYGKINKIPKNERKKTWDSLPQSDKEVYIAKLEEIRKSSEAKRTMIKEKVANLKNLMKNAKELEQLKIELKLISSTKSRK